MGELTTWDELNNTKTGLGDIDVVFDNPLSSTVRWCVDSILGGQEFKNPNIGAVKTSAAVIAAAAARIIIVFLITILS